MLRPTHSIHERVNVFGVAAAVLDSFWFRIRKRPTNRVSQARVPAEEKLSPSSQRICGKFFCILFSTSYLFWLVHSFAVRQSIVAIRYLIARCGIRL
jgi:hypothetical protein